MIRTNKGLFSHIMKKEKTSHLMHFAIYNNRKSVRNIFGLSTTPFLGHLIDLANLFFFQLRLLTIKPPSH